MLKARIRESNRGAVVPFNGFHKRTTMQGFTLIELISVIIILGILSATATGLFSAKSDFESAIVKNQLLSSLRLTQQLSLSRQNLTTAVPATLMISEASDIWSFNVWDSNPAISGNSAFATDTIDGGNVTLRFSTADFLSACSSLATSTSYSVSYDGDGNLLSGARLRICIVGEQTYQVCVSSLGFAYEGSTCL